MVEETWPWSTGGLRPVERTSGRLQPWAWKWPPSWWPKPLLQGRGSVRAVLRDQHSKFFVAEEAVHVVRNAKKMRLESAPAVTTAAPVVPETQAPLLIRARSV